MESKIEKGRQREIVSLGYPISTKCDNSIQALILNQHFDAFYFVNYYQYFTALNQSLN